MLGKCSRMFPVRQQFKYLSNRMNFHASDVKENIYMLRGTGLFPSVKADNFRFSLKKGAVPFDFLILGNDI